MPSDHFDQPAQPVPERQRLEQVVRSSQPAFLGVELVDWLQWKVPRLSWRPNAVHYARQLLHDGLIHLVDVEEGLSADHSTFHECSLYAFTSEPCDNPIYR